MLIVTLNAVIEDFCYVGQTLSQTAESNRLTLLTKDSVTYFKKTNTIQANS